jgi:S-adenosylmethionine hydrolase
LIRVDIPVAVIADGQVTAHCLYVDHFGNASLDLDASQIADWGLETGSRIRIAAPDGSFEAIWATTFEDAEPGDLLLFEDSSGSIAIAANGGNAAALLDLAPRCQVDLTPA